MNQYHIGAHLSLSKGQLLSLGLPLLSLASCNRDDQANRGEGVGERAEKPRHSNEEAVVDSKDGSRTQREATIIPNNPDHIDWNQISIIAGNDIGSFEEFLKRGMSHYSDNQKLRDDFFRRSIYAAKDLEEDEIIRLVENFGKGSSKSSGYSIIIGTYSGDPERLRSFVEKMPYGNARSKGFQRYYSEKITNTQSFQIALGELSNATVEEDQNAIRMGIQQAGEKLIESGKATSRELNATIQNFMKNHDKAASFLSF